MKIMPIAEYYAKHGAQIETMLPKVGASGGSNIILDFANAIVPVVKKQWPELNANGLLDDTLALLGAELGSDVGS